MADNVQTFDLFNFAREEYKITKPIRLIELFAGIGAQAKALEILGIPFEHWKICEWAIPSFKAYNAIHIKDKTDYSLGKSREEMLDKINGVSSNYNEPISEKTLNKYSLDKIRDIYNNCIATHNLINVMNVHGRDLEIKDKGHYEYLLTYSFPCQDLSLAGKRRGMSISQKEGGTRSGLLWEVERILNELSREREREHSSLPQLLLMENVEQIISKQNVNDFVKWTNKLESLGYTNHFKILNAKEYGGIPQNRRRCYMLSILGDCSYEFPLKIKLNYRLNDLLEKNPDPKYNLKPEFIEYLTATDTGKYKRKEAFESSFKSTNEKGIAVALSTKQARGACDNYVLIKNATQQGYLEAEEGDGIDISTRMHHHRGTVQKGLSQTITTMGGENVGVLIKDAKGNKSE